MLSKRRGFWYNNVLHQHFAQVLTCTVKRAVTVLWQSVVGAKLTRMLDILLVGVFLSGCSTYAGQAHYCLATVVSGPPVNLRTAEYQILKQEESPMETELCLVAKREPRELLRDTTREPQTEVSMSHNVAAEPKGHGLSASVTLKLTLHKHFAQNASCTVKRAVTVLWQSVVVVKLTRMLDILLVGVILSGYSTYTGQVHYIHR